MPQLPNEGFEPTPGIYGYIKDIQPMTGEIKEVYAFIAMTNTSEKGTGKVWRRAIYVWNEQDQQWYFLCETRKTTTWRGSGFKVEYWPKSGLSGDKWSCNYFADEAEAEKFMFLTWEFFV